VLGIAFTALAFLGIRKLDPVFKRSDQFTPRMVAVINRRRKEN
jgi:sigma-E factor negative regulatory protein RseC